jgi:hypothetical protein
MPSPPLHRAPHRCRITALAITLVGLSMGPACRPKAGPASPAPPPEASVSSNPPGTSVAEPADDGAQAPPRWDQVVSGHPDGATRPPLAILAVTQDGARCYKQWRTGMMTSDPEILAVGGRVIKPGEIPKGTEIACPPQAAQVLNAYQTRKANQQIQVAAPQ